jgi:hypothetical protein
MLGGLLSRDTGSTKPSNVYGQRLVCITETLSLIKVACGFRIHAISFTGGTVIESRQPTRRQLKTGGCLKNDKTRVRKWRLQACSPGII